MLTTAKSWTVSICWKVGRPFEIPREFSDLQISLFFGIHTACTCGTPKDFEAVHIEADALKLMAARKPGKTSRGVDLGRNWKPRILWTADCLWHR
jgi:hypothetical protein